MIDAIVAPLVNYLIQEERGFSKKSGMDKDL